MSAPADGPMWLDGRPVTPAELAALALYDFGHFTTMTVERGLVRGLRLHLDRLVDDCRTVFGVDLDPDRVLAVVRVAVGSAPAAPTTTVRVTIFDPSLTVAGPVDVPPRPRVLVTTRPAGAGPTTPLRLRSCAYQRDLPAVKHTGLFGAVRQRRLAQAAGFDDALFVTADGHVLEGPTWNVGFVVDGEVRWPAGPCLPGVTMRLVSAAAEAVGLRCRSAPVSLSELTGGHGAFVTNASVGVRAVAAIDGTPLADAPLVRRLGELYAAGHGDPLDRN
ncbi:aminotransferase class IV [Micromonospora sp. NBC_01813]|uniref:aminotransferase class IV n=1 Tax=Micromonospora sp. NBC_01813 TaxID=2975988 RepID=UPI002DDAD909|nr:aminotransferase class IV [Micromonospora sp. NBC_01813]WSA10037.1 aminotransferase class IV [Micromonospora sp. NBC_01813]